MSYTQTLFPTFLLSFNFDFEMLKRDIETKIFGDFNSIVF